MLFGLPWWVYMLILFIFLSGYMAFRAIRAEKQLEQHYIEREGTVFMERIAHEKQMKLADNQETASHDEYIEEETPAEESDFAASDSEAIEDTDTEPKRQISV